MTRELELVLCSHLANSGLDSVMLELDQTLAMFANEVFVLRISVIVIVIRIRSQLEFAEQTGVDQFRERPVHGGPADVQAR